MQLALALAMESVVAFEYFFFLFAKYLSIAAVASEFYGVYSFVVGSMQSVVDLLIYACMEVRFIGLYCELYFELYQRVILRHVVTRTLI